MHDGRIIINETYLRVAYAAMSDLVSSIEEPMFVPKAVEGSVSAVWAALREEKTYRPEAQRCIGFLRL